MLRFTNQLVKKAGTNYASNQKAALFIGGLSKVKAKSMNQQQRPFIEKLKTMVDYVSKGNSPNAVDGMKDRKQLVSYFRSISLSHPKECIEQIHSGWQNGKVPANEDVIREYLKAAAVLKKLDTMDLNGLLSLASKERQLAGASSGISPEAFYAAMNANKTFGSTSTDPIYIKNIDAPGGGFFVSLRKFMAFFLLVSVVASIMDDKTGAAGAAISSRLGMSSTVRQAEESDKSFDDVVGIDEAKAELEEIVLYLKDSSRFTRLGGKLPKGILLTGQPGTGKTLLARAIAGEAKVPFFFASGSEFEEMYVGVGAKRVRDLFEAAKAKTPCIIFIDEIDAIGGSRNLKDQSATKMTLNQLLVEMDGFEQNKGIIVIAATNYVKSLDSALVRPGRFDKVIDVQMPDIAGRKAILELYSKNVSLNVDVDMQQIAKGTPGFSGADLQNLVNQAAVKASMQGLKSIGMQAFEWAKDKILMGAERRSAVLSPETIKMTAFHEAGHALVALKTDGADPIHKATVMPRGSSLGMVMQLPDHDQTSQSRKQMLAYMDICMGGRVAEELVYGADNVTSGASSDIQQATKIAKMMVTKWGMSDKVGLFFVDDKDKQSGEFQQLIDDEVRQLLHDSYERSKKVLETNRKDLDVIAHGLIEFETLSGGEIVDLLSGIKPDLKGLRSQRSSSAIAPTSTPTPTPSPAPSLSPGAGAGSKKAILTKDTAQPLPSSTASSRLAIEQAPSSLPAASTSSSTSTTSSSASAVPNTPASVSTSALNNVMSIFSSSTSSTTPSPSASPAPTPSTSNTPTPQHSDKESTVAPTVSEKKNIEKETMKKKENENNYNENFKPVRGPPKQ